MNFKTCVCKVNNLKDISVYGAWTKGNSDCQSLRHYRTVYCNSYVRKINQGNLTTKCGSQVVIGCHANAFFNANFLMVKWFFHFQWIV